MNNLKYTVKRMDTVLRALVIGAFATTAVRAAESGQKPNARAKRRRQRQRPATEIAPASYCEPVPVLPISPPSTFSMNEYLAQGQRVPSLNRLGEKEAPANNPLPPRDYVF